MSTRGFDHGCASPVRAMKAGKPSRTIRRSIGSRGVGLLTVVISVELTNCFVPTCVTRSPTLRPPKAPGPTGRNCVTISPVGSLLALSALRISAVVSATPILRAGTQRSWPPVSAGSEIGSGRRPIFIAAVCCEPERKIVNVTRAFGTSRAVILLRSLNVTGAVPIFSSTSPIARVPTEGPSASTPVTKMPIGVFMCRAVANSGVIDWAEIPRYPRSTRPCASSSRVIAATVSAGIANPKPTDPPLGEKMVDVTPMTVPSTLNSGPPELPRLIAASVCRKSIYGSSSRIRDRAEMMPALTD